MAHTGGRRPIVPRGRLWKKQRAGIIVRDGRTCQYCGLFPLGSKKDIALGRVAAEAHCDHVKPLEKGGEDEIWNYVLACETCNKQKSNRWAPDLVIGNRNVQTFYATRRSAFLAGAELPGYNGGAELAAKPSTFQEPSNRDGRPGRRSHLNEDTIDRMWRAFTVRPSASYVSDATGVHHNTARRYIDHGHPSRGIEPFSTRYARIKAEANRRADERLTEHTADMLATATELWTAMVSKVSARDPETGRIKDLHITPDYRDIVEMGRFRNVLAGGVDKRVGVEHRFQQMSEDELEAYIAEKNRARAEVIEAEVVGTGRALAAAAGHEEGEP